MRNHWSKYWSDYLCLVALLGVAIVVTHLRTTPPEKPQTCERLDTGVCLCNESGPCLCEPGGRSCPACKHLRSPEEEAEIQQVKLMEQAERATPTDRAKKYVDIPKNAEKQGEELRRRVVD